MERVIRGRNPDKLFYFFEEISAIPRESYHEEKIADYLVAFAKERGLFVLRDKANNVFIRKDATPGMEGVAPILLQAHIDMVCEKNEGVEHDFRKDGIELEVRGDFLSAKGTTLGADDGAGVAVMLAALDGELPRHPTLECLFTSSEEVGLGGVCQFDFSVVSARRLINLDNEELGQVIAGSCGGVRTDITMSCKREEKLKPTLHLALTGFAGGHSGENINEGRMNANVCMGRLLCALHTLPGFGIVSIDGGSKLNAIPRECRAVIALDDPDDAFDLAERAIADLSEDFSPLDQGAMLSIESGDEAFSFTNEDSLRILALFQQVPNGVLAMSKEKEGLVEWSRNLGIVATDGDTLRFGYSTRSGKEEQLDRSEAGLSKVGQMLGATVAHFARYPGWEYAPVSRLREEYLAAYEKALGKKATVNVIHAGLECGEIFARRPDMDIIAIGPTMYDIHSPSERMDLRSCEDFWKVLAVYFEGIL